MPQVLNQPESKTEELKPLCVDLDGTLVKSDTLIDSLLVLARTHPLLLLRLPGKLLGGKAHFKAFVTENVALDVAHLPYNRKLVQFLQQEHARGRKFYLATGADVRLAQRVADHLGFFDGVLGSDGINNLTGHKKLDSLRNQFGRRLRLRRQRHCRSAPDGRRRRIYGGESDPKTSPEAAARRESLPPAPLKNEASPGNRS